MGSNFNIPSTVKTPEITIDADKGKMIMRGRSLPEDAIEFYKDTVKELELATQSNDFFKLYFYIEYLNTSSSSVIRSIMELFNNKKEEGIIDFKIYWHFEEDDLEMEETGYQYAQTIPGLPIELIEVDAI